MTEKALGIVVWFNVELGCGFIRPDDGTPDTFVQVSELRRCGLTSLRENERVSYTVSFNVPSFCFGLRSVARSYLSPLFQSFRVADRCFRLLTLA
jgi:cold shock protein